MRIGDALARQVPGLVGSLEGEVAMLVPVPLRKKRLKERGYNQVALVARTLADDHGLQFSPQLLWKACDTRSQIGSNVSGRKETVSKAYQAERKTVTGRSDLWMDDAVTTGAAFRSGADALLSAGAREAFTFTMARTSAH